MALIACPDCKRQISHLAEVCPKCGRPMETPQQLEDPAGLFTDDYGDPSQSDHNRLAAALFAILLGGLGIHKFYLGRTGMGVFYLLFCWTLLPAIAGLIEGLVLLTMSEQEFKRQFG